MPPTIIVAPLSTSHPGLLNFIFLAVSQATITRDFPHGHMIFKNAQTTAPPPYLNVNGTYTVIRPRYPKN